MFNSGPIGFLSGGYLAKDRSVPSQKELRRAGRDDRRIAKYERRMDSGRDLSRKKQRRYDRLMAEQGVGYGQGDVYDRGYGGRRRRGGPIGLVGGLVGGAVGAVTGGGQKSREYEDSYSNRSAAPAPHAEYGRRSFDDRRSQYEQSSAYASSGKAPAPYGSYGGSAGMYPARQRNPRRARRGGGPLGVVRRIMTEDVLYLMIVNMPSEAEMAEAMEKLERAKSGH